MITKQYNQQYYKKNRRRILEQVRKYVLKNKDKVRERQRKYRETHVEECRIRTLRYKESGRRREVEIRLGLRKYNLTVDEYNNLLKSQNGKCAICRRLPKTFRLSVDHNHRTGNNRGLLCGPCNRGIGMLRESPVLLLKAVEYLFSEHRGTR